jgi:Ca2+-binding RTX toxin-like protein
MSRSPEESFQFPETFEPMILMSASAAELSAEELSAGTAGNDLIIALTPDELIDGGAGHDIMIALGGSNVLRGGAGHDTLISARGDNVLDGGAGIDKAVYWNGNRADFTVTDHGFGIIEIAGSKNSDFITNIEQVQFQDGVYSIQELLSGATNAPALGVESQDAAEQTVDSLKTPTTGNDVLVANLPGESIDALAGDDIVVGLGNGNTILGSEGNDAILSAGGNNIIDGGAGNDTVVYGGLEAEYTLASAPGGAISVSSSSGQDILINVETVSFQDVTRDVASLNLPPVVEEPVVEEPVVEEPVVEEPVVEEPVVEEPVVEEPVVEEPVVEEPVVEEPVVEEPVDEEPVDEEPVVEEPVVEEPVDEEPVDEEPVDEEPVDEEPVDEEPGLSFELPVAGDLYATVGTNPEATYELLSPPSVGSINFYADGSFDYHAPVGFSGVITFQYQITAADGTTVEIATLVITSADVEEPTGPDAPVEETPVEEVPEEEVTEEAPVDEVPEEIDGLHLNPNDAVNLIDVGYNGSVTVTFQSESAGYQNTFGTYLINNTTGMISDVNIVFSNASQPGSGGYLTAGSAENVAGKDGYSVGFFLLADGNSLNNLNAYADASWSFEPAAGGGLKLVATQPNGYVTAMNGPVYISSHPEMNADGKDHFRFSINGDKLQISVEDLANLGDKDFNDVIVSVEVNEEVEVIDLDEEDNEVEVIDLDDNEQNDYTDPYTPDDEDEVEVIELDEPDTHTEVYCEVNHHNGTWSWFGSLFGGLFGKWW